LPDRHVQRGVGWLTATKRSSASPRGRRRNAAPGIARNSLDGAVENIPPGLVVVGVADDDGEAIIDANLQWLGRSCG